MARAERAVVRAVTLAGWPFTTGPHRAGVDYLARSRGWGPERLRPRWECDGEQGRPALV